MSPSYQEQREVLAKVAEHARALLGWLHMEYMHRSSTWESMHELDKAIKAMEEMFPAEPSPAAESKR